ncbi:MAG: thioredoxin family protein [Chitinophagaceae bacterium]|nr:thioredoxin family protein [Chitinophagaceae bacterium]
MKKLVFIIGFVFSAIVGFSQDMKTFNLYKPAENAKEQILTAVKEAKKSGKHVLIQIGGNWCIWCARFNDLITTDKSIDTLVNDNYVVYHLNYSKENFNLELLKKYKFPQRFGFPVFLILNEEGDLIHTQNSEYLESGKGYDKEKVTTFFNNWSTKAIDPSNYKEN